MRRLITALGWAGLLLTTVAPATVRAAMQFEDYSISPVYRSCRSMGGLSRDACVCVAQSVYSTIDRGDEQLITILMQGFGVDGLKRMAPGQLNTALTAKGIYASGNAAVRASNIITGSVDYCAQPQGGN